MRLRAAVTGAALMLLAASPARAAEQQSYAAGLTYATPAVAASQGDTLRFTNLDPAAQHDLNSDTPGLFSSALIPAGQSEPVAGVERLAPGQYSFHCSIHAWMKGVLNVSAGAGAPGTPGAPGGPGGGGGDAPNPADLLPKVPPQPLDGSEWPFYGRDLSNSRNGGTSGPSYNEVPTLGPVWSFHSGDGDFTGTPVMADGTLVAGAGGGTVFALDAATGKKRWANDLGDPINGTAAIYGGRVYVPLAKPGAPSLAALDLHTGKTLWKVPVDTQKNADVFGSPVVWDPGPPARRPLTRAQRRAAARRKRALAKRRRARVCRRHGRRVRCPAPRRRRPPTTATVYIGISAEFGEVNDPDVNVRGSVVALNAKTGKLRWKSYTVPPGHDGGSVWTTPAIDPASGRLFVGTGNAYHPPAASTTDSILALSARTGKLLDHHQATAGDVWNATEGKGEGPDYDFGASPNLTKAADGRTIVGAGQKSGVYWALDRGSLDPVWTATTGPPAPVVGGIIGSTAFDGRRVYGPDTPAGELWALGMDGRLNWASSDGGPLHFGSVSVANGVVYSTDMSGHLTARDASTGAMLAKLPLGAPSWGGVAVAGGSVFAVTGSQNTSGWIVAYRPRG
ncbi:MAG: hypothetical protein QOE08_2427 [Thermoleophilaceae bacterium]|nr:hypothetical protein [Thermoleophilaceae bacterium]